MNQPISNSQFINEEVTGAEWKQKDVYSEGEPKSISSHLLEVIFFNFFILFYFLNRKDFFNP